jgi:Spy/CpxP family protein refolding chaperone
VEDAGQPQIGFMPDATETEPTDEQLAEIMQRALEAVREQGKRADRKLQESVESALKETQKRFPAGLPW